MPLITGKSQKKPCAVIEKELFCRVGKDWHTGGLFVRNLWDINHQIACKAAEILGINPHDLHNLTCVIEKFDRRSITGDDYLAKKALKLKFKVIIEECELVDDIPDR